MGRFGAQATYLSKEVARLNADVVHADIAGLMAPAEVKERCAVLRASTYVWLCALVERIVRDTLRDALLEIGPHANRLLAPSLFSILCDAELAAISDRNRQGGWKIRTSMFKRLLDDQPANFSGEILPLDGRTIIGEHFDVIWVVFDVPGPSLPSPRHRAALRELAEGRNNVAHGHVDPIFFGKAKATRDLQQLITRVDDVLTHLIVAMDDYLSNHRFKRTF